MVDWRGVMLVDLMVSETAGVMVESRAEQKAELMADKKVALLVDGLERR